MDKYAQLQELGCGSYGAAILVKRKSDDRLFVAKRLQQGSCQNVEGALQEAKLLKELSHPNIVEYVESFIENRTLGIFNKTVQRPLF